MAENMKVEFGTPSDIDSWMQLVRKVNQMYLYATSAAGFTNDVKCAFLVELSESLIEIIGKENIKLQRHPDEQGKLKPSLRTIINCYGTNLFKNEIQFDLEKILSCLVNTRVNIMHIKINQRTPTLNGKESTLYAIKMSYLSLMREWLSDLKIQKAMQKRLVK